MIPSRDYLYSIKDRINGLSETNKFAFSCLLLSTGLMKSPWHFRLLKWYVKWRLKETDSGAWIQLLTILTQKYPDSINHLLEDTIQHMLWGTDLSKEKSIIGGFNTQELNLITRFLDILDENSKS